MNEWADYWRYQTGVNVIPADTKNKKTWISWSPYQNAPIPEAKHVQWKNDTAFSKGMAVIPGKVWHNPHKKGLYLAFIDLDNQKAIDEFCNMDGKTVSLEKLSEHMIIEQHRDQPNKAHIYCYTKHRLTKKSSDRVSDLSTKIDSNEIPAFEVKGLGEHGIAYCTPSPHKNGSNYEIIGTCEPEIIDGLEQQIDSICKKYNILYLWNGNGNSRSVAPIQDLFKEDTKIYEGHNRHEAMLRVMDSLISRNNGILSEQQIRELAHKWNLGHCVPPLSENEEDQQWKAATKFIIKSEISKNINNSNKRKKGCTETEGKDSGDDLRKEYYIQKYSSGIPLAEAVIVNGLPFFLQIADDKPSLYEKIDLPDMILKPIDRISYLNKEYSFNSLDEINEYVQRASYETFDSLFQKLKAIWRKYIDADNDHITICAANTIFTYFQDKLGMTHYLLFVGDNNTGKSNNLVVLQYLGYRPLFDTSITAANIYQFLGGIEEGQGIILEDEADSIDRNDEKMRIYKVGYKSGTKVSRIDTSFGRKQQSYWTYGFKAFSAEKQPDNNRAKGFNERVFVIPCSTGNPQHDITEVINPAGDEKYSNLLDELIDIRKLLLIYRLLNYGRPIPDIELNIRNRDKQLCKPLIRLFQNSNAVKEITGTLSKLLSEKKQRKGNTFEARLYAIVRDLIRKIGTTLENKVIWLSVKSNIDGSDNPNKPQSYETEEFYTISQKRVTDILVDKFGAVRGHDGSKRILVFDENTLDRLAPNYSNQDKIQIIEPNNPHEKWTNTSNTFNTSTDNIRDIQNDKHKELAKFQQSNHEKIEKSIKNNEEFTPILEARTDKHSRNVLEVLEVLGSQKAESSTVQFLKCPQCSFQNIYHDEIAHHIKFTHNNGESSND